MAGSTNLALRPFRNERLPWLLVCLLIALAAAVSFAHGRFIGRLVSGDEAKTVRVVREDEARIAELKEGLSKEPPLRVESAELARLRAFKELVDRRVFPWRLLLSELEGTLSEDVRLTKISPVPSKNLGGMQIQLSGEARSKDAAFSLAERLDASAAFSNAVLKSLVEEETENVVQFEVEVVFDPRAASEKGRPPSESSAAQPVTPDPPPVGVRRTS
jgi:Tfp pilus assembly protein PilN